MPKNFYIIDIDYKGKKWKFFHSPVLDKSTFHKMKISCGCGK